MSKPTPITIPTDDCEITAGEEKWNPHEGETITLRRGVAVGGIQVLHRFHSLQTKLQAVKGEADEEARALALMDEAFDDALRVIAQRVVDWTWTDDGGAALPKPDGTITPFQSMRVEEVNYLLAAATSETRAERGKDSADSQTTSSGSTPPAAPTPSTSSTVRSRSKA